MSDAPHDANSLIAWFTATEIVRHDGSRSPREPRMTDEEARLLAAKIGEPSYYNYRQDEPILWSAERIWSVALDMNLFMHDRFGWVDRDGRFWGCGHASHELLLHFLGVGIAEAEKGGWVRISMSGAQSIYTPSDAQVRFLIERGLEGAARNLFNEGLDPNREDVRAAKVRLPEAVR